MKLIIECEKEYYEMLKYNVEHGQEYKPFEIIANGIPYEEKPQGDLISRSDIKDHIGELLLVYSGADLANAILNAIDNAPTVPLPNEQIAWEQGYEAGLAQGKHDRPQGEWIRQSDDYHDYYECERCGIAVGLDDIKNFCPNCGADMGGDAE